MAVVEREFERCRRSTLDLIVRFGLTDSRSLTYESRLGLLLPPKNGRHSGGGGGGGGGGGAMGVAGERGL